MKRLESVKNARSAGNAGGARHEASRLRRRELERTQRIEGERADYKTQVKDREPEFTDWGPFTNQYGPGYILQFYGNGAPYVFITHSWNLRKAADAWEKLKGKEPFTARVIEKRTKDGKTVYIFA